MNVSKNTRIMVEGALMIAMAMILSFIKILELPQGGSITLEMIPLVIMGIRHGAKGGCLTGFAHGLLQMILGFSNVMYCATLLSQVGCILLDYLLAFTVLGMAGYFAGMFGKNKLVGFACGTVVVCLLRFVCSFLSGWLLWGSYAPEGMSAVWYSLTYNGAYMIPDTIIAAVLVVVLYKTAPVLFRSEN